MQNKKGFWAAVGRHPFSVLLLTLFMMLALAPCTSLFVHAIPGFRGIATLVPLSLLIVGASMLALWKRARKHTLHMFSGSVLILFLIFGSLINHHLMALAQIVALILYIAYMLGFVIKTIYNAKSITGDTLAGAICVYFLFGLLSGFIFVLLEFLAPGSFSISTLHDSAAQQRETFVQDPGWLVYFSFMTLTTVGYGDVLPANAIARSATVLVAVIGQMLVVIQIARLVAINVAQAGRVGASQSPPSPPQETGATERTK